MSNDNNIQGQIAELKLAYIAMQEGYYVAFPPGDTAPYDLIIDNKGKLFRVQIKSVNYYNRRTKSYEVRLERGTDRRKYTKEDFDILAVYLPTYDCWYFLDIADVTAAVIRLKPNTNTGKYDAFMWNWSVFN